MNSFKSTRTFLSAGILSSVAASLCCILPVVTLIAGSSSIASNFSWFEPARPYLIGFSILVLAWAWYVQLKPKKSSTTNCECEPSKDRFWQSNSFLFMVTVFSILMMSFPLYANIFYPSPKVNPSLAAVSNDTLQQVKFTIIGMSCQSCEEEVDRELSKVNGVLDYKTSYESKCSLIRFNPLKVDAKSIAQAIGKTGYKVKGFEYVRKDQFNLKGMR